ncbi:NUDIX domain-containing protein [Cryptosporangium sp. NPDC048952]|uniref:NUDIX domain-containing protein n=1 Tax=Cryptosporangium sp. NPDC048952 TaxID=3363961 RepID=UPI0037151F55
MMQPGVIHLTASVYLFTEIDRTVFIGLVWHPRLTCWMIPGGHVEAEPPSDAALRETREETGMAARLLPPPGPDLPAAYPHPQMARPWWTVRIPVAADNHAPEPHIHEDHQYVAWMDRPDDPAGTAELVFRWASRESMGNLAMLAGTRMTAAYLISVVSADTLEQVSQGHQAQGVENLHDGRMRLRNDGHQ